MNVTGCQFVRNHTSWLALVHHKVKDVELVVELDTELYTVLVKGLQNHVAGAVGCVAAAANRSLTVIASVTTKTTLVDLAIWSSVER